jgi:sorbitol-specific phosphotransferase system component IIC
VDITNVGFIITILSFLITLIGFFVAIIQIMKTKKISKDAYSAASEAKSAMKKIIVISDLSSIIKSIQEIQNDIISEKTEIAYLHTKTLIHSLIEIRQLINPLENNERVIITEVITQLGGILRRQLESSINRKEKIDIYKINQKLSEFEITLSELSAKIKFPLSGGSK